MKANIQFEIKAPMDCTEKEFKDWILYSLGAKHTIRSKNKLSNEVMDTLTMGKIIKINISK